MKSILVAAAGLLALSALILPGGCAGGCSASADKLSALRRGMTYAEASAIMGCPGSVITASPPDSGGYSIVEWGGPKALSYRTHVEFEDGKLLSYTTERRAALGPID